MKTKRLFAPCLCLLTMRLVSASPSDNAQAMSVPATEISVTAPITEELSAPSVSGEETPSVEAVQRSPYLEHAPLAFFSLGALAVGGVVYALQSTPDNSRRNHMSGGNAQMQTALSVTGLTALVAGASYFYNSHRTQAKANGWEAQVSAAPASSGGLNVAALLTVPLPL